MKLRSAILLLLLACFVALPTSAVQACGDAGICQAAASGEAGLNLDLDDHCVEENSPCQDCPPDTDGCGHCHCPGCGTTGASQAGCVKNISAEMSQVADWSGADRAANFCYQPPSTSAHLAALFQPPRR